ncbi:MAG: MerR family DNA-binding transcriptional regulator [Chloroflexi bacterium]|nr:MerR family DNA-binding transcriptional regulator [Chloroflexota bacterium]
MPNINSYLSVSEAASFVGVSASTIRNWDRTGKLKAVRHPINNYRLYDRRQLQDLLDRIGHDNSSSETRNHAWAYSKPDWRGR